MNRVKQAVHAENVYKYGLSGKNVTVAIMDTGVAMHRDFDNRILAFHDFCNGYQAPYDDNGHGTHVTGIIAGSGRMSARENGVPVYGGMAPQAGIVMLKVLDKKGNGKTGQVLEAIRWLREHRAAYNIRLLNISVGMLSNAGISEQQALLRAVDGLWDAGIMVVAAAGNNGPRENTVTIPGISRKIVTVGSSDDGRKYRESGKRLQWHGTDGVLHCEAGDPCSGHQYYELCKGWYRLRQKKRNLHGGTGRYRGIGAGTGKIPESDTGRIKTAFI